MRRNQTGGKNRPDSGRGGAGALVAGVVAVIAAVLAPGRGWAGVAAGGIRAGEIERLDVESLEASAQAREPFRLILRGREYVITLEPNDLRSVHFGARAVDRFGPRRLIPPLPRTFRGKLAGDPRSEVRIAFAAGGAQIFIDTDDETLFVEPEPLPSTSPSGKRALGAESGRAHRVYTTSDPTELILGHCEADIAMAPESTSVSPGAPRTIGAAPSGATGERAVEASPASFLELEVAVEADYEYFVAHGAETTAVIEAIFNTVDGIYQSELGITITLSRVVIHEDDAGRYTSTSALDLLHEFRQKWNSERSNVPRDVVHLLTGRELEGTTVGIAFVDEVCHASNAYGLSQDIGSTSLMPILVSHEIGHNLGSGHDNPNSLPHYIMNAVLSSATLARFSDSSATQIADYLSGVDCLATVTGGDGGVGDPREKSVNDPIGTTPPTGSGGGGGGPVDPWLLLMGLAWLAARRMRAARPGAAAPAMSRRGTGR